MKEFLQLFDINDISQGIWQKISDRLEQKIFEHQNNTSNKNRYKNNHLGKIFTLNEYNQFNGIINYLNNESNGNIQNLIEIKS